MFANVPSVNSLSSVYSFLERPVVQGELNRLQAELGPANFPVIQQQYFAGFQDMMYTNAFPCVVKLGHAHAGMGKMRVQDHHDFEDFRSIVVMSDGKYCTAEPFLDGEYDLRLQRIGPNHHRAYRRQSVSGNWKTNTGTSIIEEVQVTEEYRRWLDAAATMFGGLDICTVDAIHDRQTGKEFIIEVNGTSSGLAPDNAVEDSGFIRDLVLEKMNVVL
jgi:glutathione synthase/RimK-type ligase-like ATP-grasp enzyme